MRKRVMLAVVLVTFLSSGIFSGFAMADTLEFTSIYGTEWNAGRMNFVTTHDEFQWGYCIENGIWSNWSPVQYEYVLRPVTGYFSANDRPLLGLIAADLILRAGGSAVTEAGATALQHAIWGVQGNINDSYANYKFTYEYSLLESYFDIAYVENVDGYGQDFIVWHPVPEPATMLLLGLGLIGIGVAARRKFVK